MYKAGGNSLAARRANISMDKTQSRIKTEGFLRVFSQLPHE
jgi:hypothetical protein